MGKVPNISPADTSDTSATICRESAKRSKKRLIEEAHGRKRGPLSPGFPPPGGSAASAVSHSLQSAVVHKGAKSRKKF